MKITSIKILLVGFLIIITLTASVSFVSNKKQDQKVVSEFGKYWGYTQKLYDGYKRVSDFLTLSDGTRLAYDVYLPTQKGIPASQPLPVLFKYTPYGRTWTIFDEQGHNNVAELIEMKWYENLIARIMTWLIPAKNRADALFQTEWLAEMVKYGYVIVVVDRTGTGASFGKLDLSPEAGARETDQILNWIADQTWCDGNIGMFGDSIQAQIQFQAASTGNPHLKAILPATTWWDNYSAVLYPGGIRNEVFLKFYAMANTTFDLLATPIDRDPGGELLAQARKERQGNSLVDLVVEMPEVNYRDAKTAEGERPWIEEQSLFPIIDQINRSGIPVYLIDGWFDIYARDDLVTYANLTVPKRLLIRPTDHSSIEGQGTDVDYGAEAHRWFDYWLKGVDNGIMDEPPIHYSIMRGNGTTTIHATTGVADEWPLKNQALNRYYFRADHPSKQQGSLVLTSSTGSTAHSAVYTIDYSTTSGGKTRWASPATLRKYPNMRTNDAKALTFTTPVLIQAVEVSGHPVLHVWLSTQAPDLDVFAYLEEVDQQGNSTYITEGCLRASHRLLGQAPYDYLSLPFHTFYKIDQRPIHPEEPFELVFDMLPTAYQFSQGKQIRIALTFADAGNFTTPILDPAPVVTLLQDAEHPSFVDLPVVKNP
jgi:putative CocE/NonD family hydrolase